MNNEERRRGWGKRKSLKRYSIISTQRVEREIGVDISSRFRSRAGISRRAFRPCRVEVTRYAFAGTRPQVVCPGGLFLHEVGRSPSLSLFLPRSYSRTRFRSARPKRPIDQSFALSLAYRRCRGLRVTPEKQPDNLARRCHRRGRRREKFCHLRNSCQFRAHSVRSLSIFGGSCRRRSRRERGEANPPNRNVSRRERIRSRLGRQSIGGVA